MAGDEKQQPGEKAMPGQVASGADKEDHGIPAWIKTLGGIIGVIAAAIGVIASVNAIMSQSRQFSLQIAERQEAIEREKSRQSELDLTKERQVTEQQESQRLKAQAEKDAAQLSFQEQQLKLQEHRLDISATERQAAATASRLEREAAVVRQREDDVNVSDLITKVLSDTGSTEGSLAQLSRYISRYAGSEPGNLQPILDALHAKLEQIRTVSEIRLIFKLLREIGSPALESAIQANRNARAEFDRRWVADFRHRYGRRIPPLHRNASGQADADDRVHETLARALKDEIDKASNEFRLPVRYLTATLLQSGEMSKAFKDLGRPDRLLEFVEFFRGDSRGPAPQEASTSISIYIYSQIMAESKSTIQSLSANYAGGAQGELDFSNCYLGATSWGYGSYPSIRFDGAYVGQADFSSARIDRATHESLATKALGVEEGFVADVSSIGLMHFIPASYDRTVRMSKPE
jgi:hypothetical protein